MYTYTSQHMRLVVELHTKPLTVTGTHRSTRAINCMNWDPLLINDLSVAISLGACEYSWHDGSEQPRFRRGTLASFAGRPVPPPRTRIWGCFVCSWHVHGELPAAAGASVAETTSEGASALKTLLALYLGFLNLGWGASSSGARSGELSTGAMPSSISLGRVNAVWGDLVERRRCPFGESSARSASLGESRLRGGRQARRGLYFVCSIRPEPWPIMTHHPWPPSPWAPGKLSDRWIPGPRPLAPGPPDPMKDHSWGHRPLTPSRLTAQR